MDAACMWYKHPKQRAPNQHLFKKKIVCTLNGLVFTTAPYAVV